MTVATSFVPVVREDCGDVYWSHPAFKGGFGEPNGYLIYVNGGPAQEYTPGVEVQVAEDGDAWSVTLKATYPGMGFEHQLGQHKGQADVCVIVPAQPEPLFKWVAGEPVTDCVTGEVTVTSAEWSAGYWLDEDANEWVLGDWATTGGSEVVVEVPGVDACPVDEVVEEPTGETDEEPVDEAVTDEPVKESVDGPTDEGVGDPLVIIPVDDTFVVDPAEDDFPSWPEVGEPVTETVTETATVAPVSKPGELAVTGGDMLTPILFAAVAVAVGGALLVRKFKRA